MAKPILILIRYRLLCCKTCNNQENVEMNKSLLKMAAVFEEKLYQMSSSRSMYTDISTLDARVKLLAMQIGKKVENRRQLARSDDIQSQNHVNRLDALEAKVGSKVLKEIIELVGVIENIKLTGYLDLLQSSNGCCSQPGQKKDTSSSGHDVPLQVHNIYFRTHLVTAFRRVTCKNIPPSDMSPVDNVDWSSLVKTARDHVEAFNTFLYVVIQRLFPCSIESQKLAYSP